MLREVILYIAVSLQSMLGCTIHYQKQPSISALTPVVVSQAYLKGHHAKRKSTKKGGDEDDLEEADEAAGDEGEGEGREAIRAD